MSNTTVTEATVETIETALAAAKARKAKTKGARPTPVSAEDRAAAKASRDAARAERQAAKAQAAASRKPPHLKKVEKALAGLPNLTEDVSQIYNSLVQVQSPDQLLALAAHLQQHVRLKRTLQATASSARPVAGNKVRIVGGDHRYLGLTGTVDRAQRIRCYVTLEGRSKPLYLFTSDVEVVTE